MGRNTKTNRRPARTPIATTLIALALSACGGGGGGGEGSDDDQASANRPPDPVIETLKSPLLGESMPLNAERSRDPEGDALSFQWTVIDKPNGSEAELSSNSGNSTSLVPDRAGEYAIELTVSDGETETAEVRTVQTASRFASQAPQADPGDDQRVVAGDTVQLDVRLPNIPGNPGDPGFSYTWSLLRKPDTSNEVLDSSSKQTSLTPDVPGAYIAQVVVGDGEQNYQFRRTIFAGQEPGDGGRLDAAPSRPVSEATYDLYLPRTLDGTTEVSRDPDLGMDVLRSEIQITFTETAQVSAANAVLDQIEGEIVAMTGGTRSLLVRIPDPGNLADLRSIIDSVESMTGVGAVSESLVPEADFAQAMPGNLSTASGDDMGDNNHHFAVRTHGLWGMREALPANMNDRPWIVIGDLFGDGEPNGDYAASTRSGDYATFNDNPNRDNCAFSEPCSHGYHVLGTILGQYGNGPGNNNRDQVTGTYPAQLRVRAVDMTRLPSLARLRRQLIGHYINIVRNDQDARIVTNTSVGVTSQPPVRRMNRRARRYAGSLRTAGITDNVLHATSAGNVPNSGPSWPSRLNTGFAFATLGDIRGLAGIDVPELDNILVVENRQQGSGGASSRHTPGCLNGGSLTSGNISGIGSGVHSFGNVSQRDSNNNEEVSGAGGSMNKTGTSMSTPQVAGIAAFAWSVNPGLTSDTLRQRILDTTRSDYGPCTTAQPVVDAYDAVRAANSDAARRAMLDVADSNANPAADGRFDNGDLQRLLGAGGSGSPSLTYGPLDPNADGFPAPAKGSSFTDQVDLNADASRGNITQNIDGFSKPYDETSVTDLDVICHEAFASIFQGNANDRNRLLGEPCGVVDLEITYPPAGATITEGDRVEVTADVTLRGNQTGDVSLRTGGMEQASEQGYGPADNTDVTLETRRVCPSDPSVTMRFNDSQDGFRTEDQLGLTVDAPHLRAIILGDKPRYVRVESNSQGQFIGTVAFRGKGSLPICTDPTSQRLNQGNVVWRNDRGSPLRDSSGNKRTGKILNLGGDYLADGSGGFTQRTLRMRFTRSGNSVADSILIKPCTSTLGQNRTAPAGYPECPDSAVTSDLAEDLESTFGTTDPDEINRRIGLAVNGLPDFRGVLDELGEEPCDPRFCDPAPPGFPTAESDILGELAFTGRSDALVTHLEDLFAALDDPTDAGVRESLNSVTEAAAQDDRLTDNERALFVGAYSSALASLDYFARRDNGGSDGWDAFLTEAQQEEMRAEGQPRAPARRSVEGYLTAVTNGDINANYAESNLAKDAAAYGAAIGAAQEAFKVKEDSSTDGG